MAAGYFIEVKRSDSKARHRIVESLGIFQLVMLASPTLFVNKLLLWYFRRGFALLTSTPGCIVHQWLIIKVKVVIKTTFRLKLSVSPSRLSNLFIPIRVILLICVRINVVVKVLKGTFLTHRVF